MFPSRIVVPEILVRHEPTLDQGVPVLLALDEPDRLACRFSGENPRQVVEDATGSIQAVGPTASSQSGCPPRSRPIRRGRDFVPVAPPGTQASVYAPREWIELSCPFDRI